MDDDRDGGDEESPPRFLPILFYVLGFMLALALLAAAAVWILRRVA